MKGKSGILMTLFNSEANFSRPLFYDHNSATTIHSNLRSRIVLEQVKGFYCEHNCIYVIKYVKLKKVKLKVFLVKEKKITRQV